MTASIRLRETLLRGLIVVLALASAGSAKTLMWLVDWYDANMDSVISVDSVFIPHYNGTKGYYFGTADQMLAKTTAYAPDIAIPNPVVGGPRGIARWWFSLPNWNSANYSGGLINIGAHMTVAQHTNYGALKVDTLSRGSDAMNTGELNRGATDKGTA